MKILNCVLSLIFVFTIVHGVGMVACIYQNNAMATSNTFEAFTSATWLQTSREDFQQGSRTHVDFATAADDVLLSRHGKGYRTLGTLTSQVLDTGQSGTKIDLLVGMEDLPPSTSITFQIRASDTDYKTNDDKIPWIAVEGTSPESAGLPSGRYIQWRATLSTTDASVTPVLKSVEVWYH